MIALVLLTIPGCRSSNKWRQVEDGLFVAEFKAPATTPFQKLSIFIIKIDPHNFQFQLLSISETGQAPMTTLEWSKKYNLIGVINAGMYQTDLKSNVGFMKNFEHINNNHLNSTHQSIAAFNPIREDEPPFYIYDLDQVEKDSVLTYYHTAIQNLRLIKRPGENRWQKQNEKWSEAALGQDKDGNVLFIYCRRPVSMYALNNALLRLPIGLVCAQHLDGGPHASLYFSHNGEFKYYIGAAEIHPAANKVISGVALPNVIGFRKRQESASRQNR